MKKIYFPNCNGLRCLASLLVIIYHIEQVKSRFGIPNHADNKFLFASGTLGIISFFVLSGFLITYLLLKEKEETSKISFKNFYIRRILRIWPLYYFIIGLSLFVLPNIGFFHIPGLTDKSHVSLLGKTILYFVMLPNVAIYRFGVVPYASQTWSIGVEEQCYLLWPFLIGRFKNIYKVLTSVIIIYLLIKFGLILLDNHLSSNYYTKRLVNLWGSLSIDCMAIGGLASLALYYKKEYLLKIIFHKYTQISLYTLLAVLPLSGFEFYKPLFFEFYAVLFAVMILNLAANKNTIVHLENKVLNYLGKISYGLYMYHVIAIVIVLRLTSITNPNNIVLYAGSFALTIVMSVLSYEFFEKRFLQSKKKYSTTISGDNAAASFDDKNNLPSTVIIHTRKLAKSEWF